MPFPAGVTSFNDLLTHVQNLPVGSMPPQSDYICPLCKDKGFLRSNVPQSSPLFGKVIPCECQRDKVADVLFKKSELKGRLGNASFAGFVVNGENKRAFNEALAICRKGNGWLTLCGNYGTGKSTLLASAVNYHLDLRQEAVYFTLADLFDSLKEEGFKDYSKLMARLRGVKCLAIDEVDKANLNTDWAREKLYQLFDHRYNRIDDLITLYAMNKTPKQMIVEGAGLDRHHYDRMRDEVSRFVLMDGESNRPISRTLHEIGANR